MPYVLEVQNDPQVHVEVMPLYEFDTYVGNSCQLLNYNYICDSTHWMTTPSRASLAVIILFFFCLLVGGISVDMTMICISSRLCALDVLCVATNEVNGFAFCL